MFHSHGGILRKVVPVCQVAAYLNGNKLLRQKNRDDERQVACPSSRQVTALLAKRAFKVGEVSTPAFCLSGTSHSDRSQADES